MQFLTAGNKIKAIRKMSEPQNVGEVKSLLGMTQYVSRYIPEYATITTPLRLLTRKDAPWQWSHEQQRAFDMLKRALTDGHVMSYFDPTRETKLVVDASPAGLGGLQEYRTRRLSAMQVELSAT